MVLGAQAGRARLFQNQLDNFSLQHNFSLHNKLGFRNYFYFCVNITIKRNIKKFAGQVLKEQPKLPPVSCDPSTRGSPGAQEWAGGPPGGREPWHPSPCKQRTQHYFSGLTTRLRRNRWTNTSLIATLKAWHGLAGTALQRGPRGCPGPPGPGPGFQPGPPKPQHHRALRLQANANILCTDSKARALHKPSCQPEGREEPPAGPPSTLPQRLPDTNRARKTRVQVLPGWDTACLSQQAAANTLTAASCKKTGVHTVQDGQPGYEQGPPDPEQPLPGSWPPCPFLNKQEKPKNCSRPAAGQRQPRHLR